ncbi:hypothetical protein [Domibacillus tundrae]|uniref:hypothetical protein n=1 Tax=Domibacillus tundrae TaxID=1587527 RepID=UPI000617E7C4|nr:hypothetical protein [Domibacillus tundrae]
MEKHKVWISNEVFNWRCYSNGGGFVDSEKWKRAYYIWEYAKNLIENASSDFQLADGVANLKRSLNQRLQLIEEIYNFRSISNVNKQKRYLELLEAFGIVRPLFMKKLMLVRNDIEHNDAKPPNVDRCLELLDVVWYFLRSTDFIVQLRRYEATFDKLDSEGYETQYSFSLNVDHAAEKLYKISGWFPTDYISEEFQNDYVEVIVKKYEDKKAYEGSPLEELHDDKLESDKLIQGYFQFTSEDKKKIIPLVLYAI